MFFDYKSVLIFSSLPCVLRSSITFGHPNYNRWSVQVMKQFSADFPLGPDILLAVASIIITVRSYTFLSEWPTWVKVVLCRRLAGVGHDAVVGVWPACWGALVGEGPPLPSSDCGSGFNFLNAPSAPVIAHRTIRSIKKEPRGYISEGFKGPDQRRSVMSSNMPVVWEIIQFCNQ